MLFTESQFFVLLLTTLTLYYLTPSPHLQLPIVVASSFIFYSASNPWLSLLLCASILVNWFCTKLLIASRDCKTCQLILLGGVGFNLLCLGFFKYADFVVELLGGMFSMPAWTGGTRSIPLPVGISFYTFQGISLLIDEYKQSIQRRETHLHQQDVPSAIEVTHYISFFPQLVAGPIVKARDFLPQISLKSILQIRWWDCFRFLVTGYFLKMFVADNLKDFTFWMKAPYFEILPTWKLQILPFVYSCQIFADFAGYSLIALGLAGLFGYQLPVNFDAPYASVGLREFWRRWHISLSSWLREYLYIPLGGNRKGELRTNINLMLVMILGGLWHGAAVRYLVWGTVHGALLVAERMLLHYIPHVTNNRLLRIFAMYVTFALVSWAWLFFQLDSATDVMQYSTLMLSVPPNVPPLRELFPYIWYCWPVVMMHIFRGGKLGLPTFRSPIVETLVYGLMLYLIFFDRGSPSAFIYFQF